ncbi:hypothetical protein QCA50_010852 [Cerrena zonata]|uniref:Uncharacterized protein n=1 Tax=Cerrena zonata TaxID=2478898 RepID=A0AAW0FXU7_9APHY
MVQRSTFIHATPLPACPTSGISTFHSPYQDLPRSEVLASRLSVISLTLLLPPFSFLMPAILCSPADIPSSLNLSPPLVPPILALKRTLHTNPNREGLAMQTLLADTSLKSDPICLLAGHDNPVEVYDDFYSVNLRVCVPYSHLPNSEGKARWEISRHCLTRFCNRLVINLEYEQCHDYRALETQNDHPACGCRSQRLDNQRHRH